MVSLNVLPDILTWVYRLVFVAYFGRILVAFIQMNSDPSLSPLSRTKFIAYHIVNVVFIAIALWFGLTGLSLLVAITSFALSGAPWLVHVPVLGRYAKVAIAADEFYRAHPQALGEANNRDERRMLTSQAIKLGFPAFLVGAIGLVVEVWRASPEMPVGPYVDLGLRIVKHGLVAVAIVCGGGQAFLLLSVGRRIRMSDRYSLARYL
jgi:hypothetical protein